MQIAYITLDEVNNYDAARMAPEGIIIESYPAVEPLADIQIDGCVYDLDHFPTELRSRVLEELCEAPATVPIALHSLWLEHEEITALHRNGVRVHRRLEPDLFEGFLRFSHLAWG